MAKSEFIMLRVTSDVKESLGQAAQLCGVSLTTFIVEAAQQAARRVKPVVKLAATKSGACPTFFRACVHEAQQGGGLNYSHPGWHLAKSLMTLGPHDVSEKEWRDRVDELYAFWQRGDRERGWEWIESNLPKCADLIPARRRGPFLDGVWKAFEEGLVF